MDELVDKEEWQGTANTIYPAKRLTTAVLERSEPLASGDQKTQPAPRSVPPPWAGRRRSSLRANNAPRRRGEFEGGG